jgi:hypothetical protein
MMIPKIISRTSAGIKVTKEIELNVMVQTMIFLRGIHMFHYGHPGLAIDH